jgi:hypothetical protein
VQPRRNHQRGFFPRALPAAIPCYTFVRVKTTLAFFALAILAPVPLLAAGQGRGPAEVAGVALGATVAEMRARYPEAKRNPDSDKDYQVYMVPAVKASEVRSAGAFSFCRARVVGGQILITNGSTAKYWLDRAIANYGPPDDCTYCDYPDMATASWRWSDGTVVRFDGSFALSIYTKDGLAARDAWEKRGENATEMASADENEDLQTQTAAAPAGKGARKSTAKSHPASPPKKRNPPPASRWDKLYGLTIDRIKGWFGY